MNDIAAKNKKVLRVTLGVVAGMIFLSFASVPLYRLTCQVTGWGGTPRRVAEKTVPVTPLAREITVRFKAEVAPDMPWKFGAEQGPVTLKIGEDGFASFYALNNSAAPVAGTAVYNVTPLRAGKYFFKTQCFCFGEQVLNPAEKVHMPVVFYVDPKIVDDPDLKDIKTITLSYTFFRKDSEGLDKAIDSFVNGSAG